MDPRMPDENEDEPPCLLPERAYKEELSDELSDELSWAKESWRKKPVRVRSRSYSSCDAAAFRNRVAKRRSKKGQK